MCHVWCRPQNGPSPSKASFSSAAASKRLLQLSGPSSMTWATRAQTASQPYSPVSIQAVPSGYPNAKSNPQSRRRSFIAAAVSIISMRSTASRRVVRFTGSGIPPQPEAAIQMLFFPGLRSTLADQSTATYPSNSGYFLRCRLLLPHRQHTAHPSGPTPPPASRPCSSAGTAAGARRR